MSDSEKQPPKPPKPASKTSTIPLKKETVRISLRSKPGDTAPINNQGQNTPNPPAAPKAPVPPAATQKPATPSPPTAPKSPTTAPATAPKPTAVPTTSPTGKKSTAKSTVRLKKRTQPLQQPGVPLGARPPVKSAAIEEDEEDNEELLPFAIGVCILSALAMMLEILTKMA